jgi:transposase, IS30 family
MKTYKQLTLEQRYQISAYLKLGYTKTMIAAELGVHKSTLSRELRRNLSGRGYRPQFADKQALRRRTEKAGPRINQETWLEIEAKIKLCWSPEQISGKRLKDGLQTVSHEWIYQHIYRDKFNNGNLYEYLRCRTKHRKRYGSNSKRGVWKNQTSIDERPEIVEQKTRIGDWETDTIIGRGHRQAIVSMVERKSKLLRIKKVEQKTGELVQAAICNELDGLQVYTLTSDNGREFCEHEKIAKKLKAKFYFCNPYSSWERGLNENTNGLIRQYFPKNMEFVTISDERIKEVEDLLNNRPRKTLGYQTPNEVYFKELVLLNVALTT